MKPDRTFIEAVDQGRTLLVAQLPEKIVQEDCDRLPAIAVPPEPVLNSNGILEGPVAANAVEAVDVADR